MSVQFQTAAYASPDAQTAFVVCAMFTPDYRPKAERLVATLKALTLPFAVFEVPHVHRSTSARGALDIAYCKARFIKAILEKFRRPVVYVDADFEFCRQPGLFEGYCAAGTDFAIYNWLTDLMNDAWAPDFSDPQRHASGQARYWRFGFGIDKVSTTQMLCSGGVQYWAPTAAAQGLLSTWEERVVASPLTPDDESLDYAFNFFPQAHHGLRPQWLPKDYSRSAYWPYVDPTINHRDVPTPHAEGQFQHLGDARLKAEELTDVSKARPYPRGAVVDVVENRIRFNDAFGRPVALPLTLPVYL